jgi:dTDP-4-dehydrorhamnose reductase
MKILLLGEKGYLGSYIHNNLDVDVLSSRVLYNNGVEYDYIINCVGKPNLEYCEQNIDETDYSNRDIIIDIQTFYPDSKIINFSSYYVYDDIGFCTEESNVTYKYNYTRQKLEGEKLITNGVTFRIGKLFGHPDLNKQNKLTEYILKNQDLVLDEVCFNPTSLEQVLRVVDYELEYKSLNGVYNLSNEGYSTHYYYGIFINKLLGTNKNITKINKIDRQFSNYGRFLMSCSKLEKIVPLMHWEYDLLNYIKSL